MRAKTATSLGAALIVAALTCLLCAGGASAKADKTKWLCKPGATPNPCVGSLETTVTSSDGATRIETAKNAKKPKIDCFYVYPTVSEQPTINANKDIDPAQTAIAEYQAARFSEDCNVYAPVYRQLTLSAISGTEPVDESARELAYGDVLSAWREYLRKYNDGRGVVLIGHSQGTGMLTALLREEIEKKRAQSKKLVAALLLGGNVTVEKGERTGGSFRRTPTCKREDETGCVIAFSTFGETPPRTPSSAPPPGSWSTPVTRIRRTSRSSAPSPRPTASARTGSWTRSSVQTRSRGRSGSACRSSTAARSRRRRHRGWSPRITTAGAACVRTKPTCC